MQHLIEMKPASWVLENVCCAIFGFSKAQLYHYRVSAKFVEGIHYARNPANRIAYCVPAIERWMTGQA